MSKSTDQTKLDNIFAYLGDEILAMSDDEIAQECIENGEDPEQIAAYCRAVCLNAIALWEEQQKGKP